MPFRTALDGVEVDEPVLRCGGREYRTTEPLENWDYQSRFMIESCVRVDETVFRNQIGIDASASLEGVVLVLQADCESTGYRMVDRRPIAQATRTPVTLSVEVPPGEMAKHVDVSVHVVLDRADGEPRADRVAFLRGSRLYTGPTTWRFALEGGGSSFPTEAIDFRDVGLPELAPWNVRVVRDLDRPFMGAVRLQVNTCHPLSDELLAGLDTPMVSILFHDVFVQLLMSLAGADCPPDDEYQEDSLGAVLSSHCNTYLQMTLEEALSELQRDASKFATRAKSGTRFGRSGE